MKCLLCVDPSDVERVTASAVGYLGGASEVVVVCAIDEGGPRGIGLSMRGLLGRRSRNTGLEATSESSARETAEKAAATLASSLSGAKIEARTLSGRPEEEIAKLVQSENFDAVLIGRGNTGPEVPVEITGTVAGFRTNHADDVDGLYIETEDGRVDVKVPPHRGEEMRRNFPEGATVEVSGSRRGDTVHAYTLSGPGERPVEAHKRPTGKRDEGDLSHVHLGHTARFVTDHVSCDVLLIS